MAYGSNPGNPGPSGDYFDDGGGAEPKTEEKGERYSGETAILPKTVLGGKEFKVGEEVVLKIVAMHENDVEVEYATGEEKGETPTEEAAESAPPAPPGEMASMME